jgi:HPt (histidine-containing phosphotransfer) domain-containing protein
MRSGLEKKILKILNTEPVLHPPEISAEVYEKFCEIFLESVPKTIHSLRENPEDKVGIQKIAHKLKGACGFAGAARLSAVAAELEQIAGGASAEELEYFHGIFIQVLSQTRAAMQRPGGAEN